MTRWATPPTTSVSSCVGFVGTLQSVDLRHQVSVALEDVAVSLGPLGGASGAAVAGPSPSKRKFTAYMPGNASQAASEQAASSTVPSTSHPGAPSEDPHPISPSM